MATISLPKSRLLRIVFLNPCIHTGTPMPGGEGAGGLAPHRPAKEKNGYNSATLDVAETCRKYPKKGRDKRQNPYIFCQCHEGQKLVIHVGAKSAPHMY